VEYLDLIRQLTAPGETDDLSAEEQDALGVLSWFWEHKGAFNTLHAQQPQTLAHAITDSPAGLLAWNAQLFNESLDEDFVLTNTLLYWLTGTAGTSIRVHCEHGGGAPNWSAGTLAATRCSRSSEPVSTGKVMAGSFPGGW